MIKGRLRQRKYEKDADLKKNFPIKIILIFLHSTFDFKLEFQFFQYNCKSRVLKDFSLKLKCSFIINTFQMYIFAMVAAVKTVLIEI